MIVLKRSRGPEAREKFIRIKIYQMFICVRKNHPSDLGEFAKSILFSIILFCEQRLLARMAGSTIGLRIRLKKRIDIFILTFDTRYLHYIRWATSRPERACDDLAQKMAGYSVLHYIRRKGRFL